MHVSKVELETLLIDGDRAATFSRLTGVLCGTGRIISYHQAQFLQFHDGKSVEYRAIIDSFDAAEQMMGHPIALPDMPRVFEDGERIAV
jgi:ketosteroid isomerase-like protein